MNPTLQTALKQFVGEGDECSDSPVVLENPSPRTVRTLRANGYQYLRKFSVLPSGKAPRWLLPLGDTNQMLASCQGYTPYRPAARLLKAMLLRVIKAGWKGTGCRQVLVASKDPLPLEVLVREVTGEREPVFAFSLGPLGAFRKMTAHAMRPSGEILGYLKFPVAKAATERVRHEAEVLERLWLFPALRPHIPTILHAGTWAERYVLFQSPGPSCRGPVEFGSLQESFLRTLWGIYQVEKPGSAVVEEVAARWQKALPLMDAELKDLGAKALKRADSELNGLTVPCGIMHGDFVPWNMRVNDTRLFLFDWEYAAWEAPRSWDFFHFQVQTACHLGKRMDLRSPVWDGKNGSASLLLYLLRSLCEFVQKPVSHKAGISYRRRILLRKLC